MKEKPTYEELKRANDLLREKVRWLEGVYHTHRDAGSQVQSRFLSNISHEIRTPMNAILGFSNLLQENGITECEKEDYLKYISLNSKALLKVMDNIIDLTLLESNNLNLKEEEVFVDDMVKMIHRTIQNEVIREMQYPVALLVTMPRDCGRITINADGHRLQRMLDTLVTNAIKMQKKGVIELKLELLEAANLRISVVMNKNTVFSERAQMIFEKAESKDDWYNYLDHIGMTYKLARKVVHEMGGKVSLVRINNRRTGLCIDLPAGHVGIKQKPRKKDSKAKTNYLN